MSDLILRTVLTFELHDGAQWFANKKRVNALVDVLVDSELATSITHAGVMGKERPAKGADAVRKAMATGKSGTVTALDAPDGGKARMNLWFDFDTDRFRVTLQIGGPALQSRKKTILPALESIGTKLATLMRPLGGLAIGFTHPMSRDGWDYPHVRPPITHPRLEVGAVLDFIDLRFHRGRHDAARPDDFVPMGTAKVPKQVQRTVHDDLVVLRWIDSIEDERALGIAAGRHERWLAGVVEVERSSLYGPEGDRVVELSERSARPPFTMYDSDEGIGYKAIAVDPKGKPDPVAWAEMTKALEARRSGLKAIRLVAPLRKRAIALGARARAAGFDAVLYTGDDDRLWNPEPQETWIDDVDPT